MKLYASGWTDDGSMSREEAVHVSHFTKGEEGAEAVAHRAIEALTYRLALWDGSGLAPKLPFPSASGIYCPELHTRLRPAETYCPPYLSQVAAHLPSHFACFPVFLQVGAGQEPFGSLQFRMLAFSPVHAGSACRGGRTPC